MLSRKAVVFVAAVLLSAIGCSFCWFMPKDGLWGALHPPQFLWQVAWHVLGIAAFFGARALDWKHWMRVAPWTMLAWLGLLMLAWTGLPIGVIRPLKADVSSCIDVWTVLWPVGTLFAGWLCTHRRMKTWIPIAILAGFGFAYFGVPLISSSSRLSRLLSGLGFSPVDSMTKFYIQRQMHAAFAHASWLGHSETSLRYLVFPSTYAVLAGISLVLGKMAVVVSMMLTSLIGACLDRLQRQMVDPSRRIYILSFAVILLSTSWCNFLVEFELVPLSGYSFSLLSCGGNDILCTWLGLGIAMSAARDGGTQRGGEWRGGLATLIWLTVVGMGTSALLWMTQLRSLRFEEPLPKWEMLGDFGTDPVRGRILAADGSVLAKSFSEWRLHIDPSRVHYDANLSSNNVVEAVAQGLSMTREATCAIYGNATSRYVRVSKRIDKKMAQWCRADDNARRYGLILEHLQCRAYPLGEDAAFVVGHCVCGDKSRTSLRGICGLEAACDNDLAGTPGRIYFRASLLDNLRTGRPTNGTDVLTTIEIPLQQMMSKILTAAVASNHVNAAYSLAMHTQTGRIAAMCAWPMDDSGTSGEGGSNDTPWRQNYRQLSTGVAFATNIAALANGGAHVRPYLVESIKYSSSGFAKVPHGRPEEQLIPMAVNVAGLEGLTNLASHFVEVPGAFALCATTKFGVLIGGFAPQKDPKYALVVGVDAPGSAAEVAVEAFKKTIQRICLF